MFSQEMQRLMTFWLNDFFTEPFVILMFIVSFFVVLFRHRGERVRLFFLLYLLVGTLLFLIADLIIAFRILHGAAYSVFVETNNTVFELVEFTAFYHFFKRCLKSKRLKNASRTFFTTLLATVCILCCIALFHGLKKDEVVFYSLIVNVIEFFFLGILCLGYFYELFTDVPATDLVKRPSFFIVTSAFFYAVLPIPFFVLANDLYKIHPTFYYILFDYHYLLLIILLFALSKAFLCKAPITT